MSAKLKDITGEKFGMLTVIEYTGRSERSDTIWLCQCECGNTREVKKSLLHRGKVWNCGCITKTRFKDISGQRFGYLTAIQPAFKKHNRFTWECKCDCGNTTLADICQLTQGKKQSCGCYMLESRRQRMAKDIAGMRFGMLTAQYFTGKKIRNKENVWFCTCDCGGTKEVSLSALENGEVTSCGCKISKSENIICDILRANNISFVHQQCFKDCIFPDSKSPAWFDIYVNNKYVIEYDGEYHYGAVKAPWMTEEYLSKTLRHDKFKTEYCKEHNIPIIRIPYTHKNDICIEDLLLETTTFRVT